MCSQLIMDTLPIQQPFLRVFCDLWIFSRVVYSCWTYPHGPGQGPRGFSHVPRSQHQSLMARLPCECSEHSAGELGSAASKLLSSKVSDSGEGVTIAPSKKAGQLLVNHRRRMESLKKVAFEAGFSLWEK